jgi:homoserine O-acetyltransferase
MISNSYYSQDMFFPPADCHAEQKLIAGSELRTIRSVDGHLALLGTDPECIRQIDEQLNELLAIPA